MMISGPLQSVCQAFERVADKLEKEAMLVSLLGLVSLSPSHFPPFFLFGFLASENPLDENEYPAPEGNNMRVPLRILVPNEVSAFCKACSLF